jgi:hypothetical protein
LSWNFGTLQLCLKHGQALVLLDRKSNIRSKLAVGGGDYWPHWDPEFTRNFKLVQTKTDHKGSGREFEIVK